MDSPFEDILHTNTVPSDSECQSIRDLLARPQKDLNDLTEELERLDALRKEISQKRRNLQRFIDAHHALLSPVRRLPEDVVRAIFMACLGSDRNPAISGQEAPLLWCQICRSWRTIALATPRLWAAIHIVVPDPSRLQQLVDRVATWLKRSGVVSLDVSMTLSRAFHHDCDISPLLSTLVAVSRRWKTIEMPLPDNFAVDSSLLTVASENLPFLETVKLKQGPTSMPPPNCASLSFLAAHGLRSLTLPASPYCLEAPVSWGSLKDLKITPSNGYLTCGVALAILRQCTTLQTCEFTIADHWDEDESVITEPFSLPQLSHLSIIRPNLLPRQSFFGSVVLPNLRSLHYATGGGNFEPNVMQLLPSTPTLECLRISAVGMPTQGYMDILSHIPTLKKLIILDEPSNNSEQPHPWYLPRDERFLEHLTLDPGRPVLCPQLEFIELQNFSAASDETLLQLVRSRTGPQVQSARLSHVVIRFNRQMDVDIMSHLEDALASGLSITLNYLTAPPSHVPPYSPLEGTDDFGWGLGAGAGW
ncbi:hypothetical protein B0H19DRAFT_1027685 [Mycena capillaripes]|nr:hypothetical protein B0H19DRAFT_1027685 [Mycena capillaripes]